MPQKVTEIALKVLPKVFQSVIFEGEGELFWNDFEVLPINEWNAVCSYSTWLENTLENQFQENFNNTFSFWTIAYKSVLPYPDSQQ